VSADDLLAEAIEAHGAAAYDEAAEITVHVRCGGMAFPMRFQRGKLRDFTGTVSTREPHAVLSPYPAPGQRGVFERGSVRIESDGGEVLSARDDPRPAFKSLRHNVWWDDLDLLYFAGYALWGYMNAPFMFRRPGFELEEASPWREDGEIWRGLRVRFPAEVPAHSREQLYYFDDRGLIRRNDYTAEVFGSWAKAAHYCWDHEPFDGLVVPTRRRAMVRRPSGKPLRPAAVVTIAFDRVRRALVAAQR
jgi:hypothetical protein